MKQSFNFVFQMKIISKYLLLMLVSANTVLAQNANQVTAIVVGKDTFPIVNLQQVTILSKRTFKNEKEEIRWDKLRRDVTKVYPYAKASGRILKDIDNELAQIPDKKVREKFLDKKEDDIKAQFEGKVRDLTITQGKILIKLIDRETSHTCFHLVKEFRGGLSAFFWQSVSRLFGSSLKYEYDTQENRDIEIIVRSLEENEQQGNGLTFQK